MSPSFGAALADIPLLWTSPPSPFPLSGHLSVKALVFLTLVYDASTTLVADARDKPYGRDPRQLMRVCSEHRTH